MSKLMRICALGVLSSMLLSYGLACNTTEGAGKDIQKGGEKLQDAAEANK